MAPRHDLSHFTSESSNIETWSCVSLAVSTLVSLCFVSFALFKSVFVSFKVRAVFPCVCTFLFSVFTLNLVNL